MIRLSFKTLSVGLAALACLPFGSVASAEAVQWVTVGAPSAAQPTPAQNAAAFAASAAITNQSYHWDSISGGVPQAAITPRTTLPGTTLTTITWNPAEPSFYQVKKIDSVDVQCTLVATFSRPFATWTAPPGTVTTLSRTGTDSTIHYAMPFVTAGDSLRDYLTCPHE